MRYHAFTCHLLMVVSLTSHGGNPLSISNWLPLNEYSSKYKISLSTLRRRIRVNDVKSRFEGGKYWLADYPIAKHSRIKEDLQPVAQSVDASSEIMSEIKRAYVLVLHEKEEQIMQLKEEIVDLKTLVKILESENDRLSANQAGSAQWTAGWVKLSSADKQRPTDVILCRSGARQFVFLLILGPVPTRFGALRSKTTAITSSMFSTKTNFSFSLN